MKYCTHCGAEVDDDAVVCLKCGCLVSSTTPTKKPKEDPNESTGWFIVLGILIPIAGLILYLVDREDYPRRAKAAGKGAIIGAIISIVLSIIASIIIYLVMAGVISVAVGQVM